MFISIVREESVGRLLCKTFARPVPGKGCRTPFFRSDLTRTLRLSKIVAPMMVFVCMLLACSHAEAKTEYATYSKTVVDGEPNESYFLVHTPKSFPDAMFLIEVKRRGYGPWEKSMGKATLTEVAKNQMHLTVHWQSGSLKGEVETAEISNGSRVRWLTRQQGRSPHDGQTFDLNTKQMPESASDLVKHTRNSNLQSALNRK